jgi:serine/threonine protein kinase
MELKPVIFHYDKNDLELKELIKEETIPYYDINLDYKTEYKIGLGIYGIVYKITQINNKKEFALKKIDKESTTIENLEVLKLIMDKIHSPNISKYCVFLHKIYQDKTHYCIIMDYILGYTLNEYRYITDKEDYTKNMLIVYLNFVVAINYLHSKDIVHVDIKPDNILINTIDWNLKLIDFDLSICYDINPDNVYTTFTDTNSYVSPQIINREHLNFEQEIAFLIWKANDIYACGMLLYFIIMGKYPKKNCEIKFDETIIQKNVLEVLKLTLDSDWKKRLNAKELVDIVMKIVY